MRWGTMLAIALCLRVCAAVVVQSSAHAEGNDRAQPPEQASQDTTAVDSRRGDTRPERQDGSEQALGDTTGVELTRDEARVERRPVLSQSAEMGAYRTLWERVALVPEVRWLGSGALGGVEGLSLRGRGLRRGPALVDGLAFGPDLNSLTPSLVDTVEILSLMRAQEEPFADGGEVIRFGCHTQMWDEPVGLLFMGRGGFSSSFNAFTFGRRIEAFSFALDLVGRSFGRAASYEGYSSDSSTLTGAYRFSSESAVTVLARRFRSDVRRYTADRTKSRLNSVAVGAGREVKDGPSWSARAHYTGNEFVYPANGPELEDDISEYGLALDLSPFGTVGGHRISLAVGEETIERSYKDPVIPDGEVYPPPDDGRQRSGEATGVYHGTLGSLGRAEVRGLVRVDHKGLFGWMPSWSLALVGPEYSFGNLRFEGGRTALAPGFLQIYCPRDEAPRPTWFMAEEMEPETGWEAAVSWKLRMNGWDLSAEVFGALRKHVLAPTTESLGFVAGLNPALVSPLEDLGDGSVTGLRASCGWSRSPRFGAGGWYSGQRARADERNLPFQPAHSAGLWIKGERKYFSDDLTLGVVLRGFYYSAQTTPTREKLPSYGVGEALGYAAIADVVFFYQIKNLETRERPGSVLDLATGEYLLQPGAEVRVGLVWYLPG